MHEILQNKKSFPNNSLINHIVGISLNVVKRFYIQFNILVTADPNYFLINVTIFSVFISSVSLFIRHFFLVTNEFY